MDLAIIKQLLRLAGITKLAVRFDDPNRRIVATFIKDSQGHAELIKFTDIEDLFTEPPSQGHSGPPVDEPRPTSTGKQPFFI